MSGQTPAQQVRTRLRERAAIRQLIRTLLILFILLALFFTFFMLKPVRGQSMSPTLSDGEWVLSFRADRFFRAPRHGDIVVVRYPAKGETYIKRLMGLPGDSLYSQGGQLYRNDEPVDEGYLAPGQVQDFAAIKAWDGQYLVLGDYRADSLDSRDGAVGALDRENLRGRAILVIWPPSAWRTL